MHPEKFRTYNELRSRHPQLPDPRWVSADGVRIDLSEAPLVVVDLTMLCLEPETAVAEVDTCPIGYGLCEDPGTPIYDYVAWLQQQTPPRFVGGSRLAVSA